MKHRQINSKRTYFILYTLLFTVIMAINLFIFHSGRKSMIWNGDGYKQHYQALVYFGRWGREIIRNMFVNHAFEVPLWDFHIGYGSDILTTLHYYVIGDPLNLLSVFVPSGYTEYLYGTLIALRLYLAGISFSLYCFEMKKGRRAALAGAFNYVFCGFSICASLLHPFFINPMIYLPLLLIGAERIFRKESPALFSGIVFLSAVSNFYFFYTLAFAVCLYVLIRFFTLRHTHFCKEFVSMTLRFAGYACIGVCMAAFILFPVILQFLGTSRMDADASVSLFYPASFYKNFFTRFMLPGKWNQWTALGFTAPALLSVPVLFGKRKQGLALKAAFLILTGMLFLPFFGKALNGFSYASNRFIYIYSGLISYILVSVWEDLLTLQNTSRLFVLTAGIAYCILFQWMGVSEKESFICALFFILLLTSALASLLSVKKQRLTLISGAFLFAALIHICLNWHETFNSTGMHPLSEYVNAKEALKRISKSEPYAIRDLTSSEKTFFRCDMDAFKIKNTAALAGVNGLQYYWSLENACISNYLREMTLNDYKVFNYNDLDHRTFLNALAGVKYLVRKNSDVLPFGYDRKGSAALKKSGYDIYENRYALPLGYTYESCIPYESYRNMKPIERQEALLQGIALEPSASKAAEKMPVCLPRFTSRSIEYSIECDETVVQNPDGSFDVKEASAAIRLTFSAPKKSETYLSLRGTSMDAGKPEYNEFMLSVSSDSSHNKLFHRTANHRYTDNQTDYLVNLGYHDQADSVITIRFPHSGSYKFDEINVICQPMEDYPKQISALRQEILEQEELGVNFVKGTIRLSKDKILCLSIPYSKGFYAIVDGKKTSLLKANTMYMALPLTAGSHTIELYYRTPGLRIGICISCAGFLFFFPLTRKRQNALRSISKRTRL